MLICSIGAVNATDLDDNSTVEVSSDVDDSISVDDALINDNVEQSQDVASTNAATWDELKTACQSSGDKVITLTGQSYNANSQIVFGNSATIVGSSDSYITEGNYTFRNNTFTNSPQTIGTDNNIIESNNVNLLKSLKFRSIVFNQPISDFNTVAQNQWAMSGYDNHNSANVPYIGVTTNPNIWKNDVGGVVSGLVIDEEGTFYLTAGSNVTAFDSTGFLKWSKNLGQVTMPGLALDNRGNIIIPVKDNRLVILNKTTGADLGGNIFQASSAYAPMLDDDGNIYVVGQYEYDNGYVPIVKYYNSTHYNPNGGYDYAYKSLFNTAVSTIPVLDNNGVLWAVSGTNLVAVDIKTGNQVASYTDCYSGIRPIVGENGIVYFVKSDRKVVYAVSVSGYLWNTSLPTYQLFGTKYE